MDTLWFLYTCALLAITLISCSLSLAVWMATRRRDCLVSAAGFIVYAFELAFIFFDEYARTKDDYPQNFDAPLTHPIESAVLSIIFTGILWTWMLMRLHKHMDWRRVLAPIAVYAVIALTLVPKDGMSSTLQQWAYWLVRDLTLLGSLLYALWCYRHAVSESERLDLARSKRFFTFACVLVGFIILEDTYMILFYRPTLDNTLEAQFFWHLSERNISENILMVACAIQLLRKNQQVLSMYFNHPPVGRSQTNSEPLSYVEQPAQEGESVNATPPAVTRSRRVLEEARAERERQISNELESRILLYGDEHGLSVRERDVLNLLIQGKDTRNIASSLVISVGTVKAHLSRIYKKVGVSGREELARDFWSS